MLEVIMQKFVWILMLVLGMASQVELINDTPQTRLVRKMVGEELDFHWQYPFEDDTGKILFAPDDKSIIWISQDSAPVYEELYEERVSLLPDGVMLKDLLKSDEGLYRTEEYLLVLNHTQLIIYTERELQPLILADDDDILVPTISTLTKIPQKIRIITQLQLPANISLKFTNGWKESCLDVKICSYVMPNSPVPDCNVSIDIDYGFYDIQLNFTFSKDASHGVTHTAENNYWWLWLLLLVVVVVPLAILVFIRRKSKNEMAENKEDQWKNKTTARNVNKKVDTNKYRTGKK